jgi:OOP family OmpA-OmpF porin
VPDADLISGMLTAIQDFVRDSFRPGEGATLRTFSVGEHTVQVEAGPQALLALVIRGEAPEAVLRKQQDTLETIHLQFANALAEFTGDASQFQSAHPLLEECLETVVDTGRQRQGRYLWTRWAIPVAVAAVALIILAARANARFNRAVAVLKSEPGLVVIDSRRRWRDWEISGLRDPQARQLRTQWLGTLIGGQPRELAPQGLHFRRAIEPRQSAEGGGVVLFELFGALDA